MSCSPTWSARVAEALAGERPWPTALWAHLAECPACRAMFDRSAAGVALLEGRPTAEALREGRREALFAALDAAERPELPLVLQPTPPRPRTALRWGLAGLLAASLAVGLFTGRAPKAPLFSGFTARGGATHEVDFKVFCLDVAGPSPQVRAVAAPLGLAARCSADDRLQFAWSSRRSGTQPLQIFLVGDGGPTWYWPPPQLDMPTGPAADQPLPGSFSAPPPGRYRVVAVVGARLIEAELAALWSLGGQGPAFLPGAVREATLEVE